MKIIFNLAVIVFLFFLSGCLGGLLPQSINDTPLVKITAIDESGLFAADQDGNKVAVAKSGLHLLDLESGTNQKLSPDRPIALAWSPDGVVLAAAFPLAEYETRLILYTTQGESLHETMLPVALSQMVWSVRGDLLLTGLSLKTFSFGGDLRQMLYRVVGDEVIATVLSNSTLKRSTMERLSSVMLTIQPVTFSPSGDELVYAHLHDPPQFLPYLQLLYQNWQVGVGRSLQEMPLQKLHFTWGESDTSIVVHSASDEHEIALWSKPGDVVKPLVTSQYRFVLGQLYDGRELLAEWGEGARLQILSAGRFLLAVDNNLYLGDGLQGQLHERYSEKIWTLRRWRFEGLITPEEYQELLREGSP